MKLLYYEIKKLIGMKYLWAALFAMLVVCCVVFAYDGGQRYSQAKLDELDAFSDFRRIMEEEPERADALIKDVRAYFEESSNFPQWEEGMSDEEYNKLR